MRAEYAQVYRDLYRRHWWWRAREAVLLSEIERHAPPAGWQTILDVGCGDGLFFEQLHRFGEPWGVEIDGSLVSPNSPYRTRIHIGPFDESFHAPGAIGLVLMLDVLEHLHRPIEALLCARELLAPNGSVLVTVPAFQTLWTGHDDLNQHVVRYTRTSLERLVREAGFRLVSSRYLFHWLYPAKLALRVLEALPFSKTKPAAVPPSPINRLLYYCCRLEELGLSWAHLPFGASVLAWCRKGVKPVHVPLPDARADLPAMIPPHQLGRTTD